MSIEVMRQALEALDHEANKGNDNAYQCERDALRAAIEQAEKRQWVGLTEEEMENLEGFYDYMSEEEFIKAIRGVEAKLKEKNG